MLRHSSRVLAACVFTTCLAVAPALAQNQDGDQADSWSSWTGAYAGAAVGGSLLASSDDNGVPGLTSKSETESRSLLGGVHLGYNFLAGQIFLGVEGDFNLQNHSKSRVPQPPVYGATRTIPGSLVNHTDSDWQGSLRARVGLPMGMFMPYVTGGVAIADMTLKQTYTAFPGIVQTKSDTLTGWTVGGGVEVLVARGVSLRVEALHTEFEDLKMPGLADPGGLAPYTRTQHDTRTDIVKTGLSFRF